MTIQTKPEPAGPLHVACLCAAWCRTCDGYAPVFEQVLAGLRAARPGLQTHWIDIEDEAELLGDLDIETFPTLVVADDQGVRFAGPLTPQPETFPTLVVADDQGVRFAGPLTPQPETLLRVLRAALADHHGGSAQPAEVLAFAQRLRARAA